MDAGPLPEWAYVEISKSRAYGFMRRGTRSSKHLIGVLNKGKRLESIHDSESFHVVNFHFHERGNLPGTQQRRGEGVVFAPHT